MDTKVRFAMGIVLLASSVPLPALAVPSQATVLADTQCAGCHVGGVGPSIAANAGGFAILDPANNLPVTAYVPSQTYKVRMRFQGRLLNGFYRNAYRLSVTAGQIVDNGQVGLVQGLLNARIVTTTDAALANTMDVNWVAPASGTVELGVFRLESNNANTAAGDFNSQLKEIISLSPAPPVVAPVPDMSTPPSPVDAAEPAQAVDASEPAPVEGAPDLSSAVDAGAAPMAPGAPLFGCEMASGVNGGKQLGSVAWLVAFCFLALKLSHKRRLKSDA